jgi:CBS domain-containing protein
LQRYDIGSVVVMEGRHFKGIVTERDCLRKVIVLGKSPFRVAVLSITELHVPRVELATTLDECMALMTQHRCRHLPVFEEDKFISVVSIGDMVHAVINDKQHTIEQLEHYIHGAY